MIASFTTRSSFNSPAVEFAYPFLLHFREALGAIADLILGPGFGVWNTSFCDMEINKNSNNC